MNIVPHYHIDRVAKTILSGPFQLTSEWCRNHVNNGNPELMAAETLLGFDVVPGVTEPLADGQKHGAAYVNEESTAVIVPAEALPVEELQSLIAQQCQQIAYEAKSYILAQIDPDGMILCDRLVRAGHQYGIENNAWLVSIRIEQYRRMAAVEAGVEIFSPTHLDFGSFGDKPWTVAQMLMAYGG